MSKSKGEERTDELAGEEENEGAGPGERMEGARRREEVRVDDCNLALLKRRGLCLLGGGASLAHGLLERVGSGGERRGGMVSEARSGDGGGG